MTIVIDGYGNETYIDSPKGSSLEQANAQYTVSIPKRDDKGNIIVDVNGNIVYLHRLGDPVLDSNGDPVPAIPSRSACPIDPALIRAYNPEEFKELFKVVTQEAQRRLKGNQTSVFGESPRITCSL